MQQVNITRRMIHLGVNTKFIGIWLVEDDKQYALKCLLKHSWRDFEFLVLSEYKPIGVRLTSLDELMRGWVERLNRAAE